MGKRQRKQRRRRRRQEELHALALAGLSERVAEQEQQEELKERIRSSGALPLQWALGALLSVTLLGAASGQPELLCTHSWCLHHGPTLTLLLCTPPLAAHPQCKRP